MRARPLDPHNNSPRHTGKPKGNSGPQSPAHHSQREIMEIITSANLFGSAFVVVAAASNIAST